MSHGLSVGEGVTSHGPGVLDSRLSGIIPRTPGEDVVSGVPELSAYRPTSTEPEEVSSPLRMSCRSVICPGTPVNEA
jgi:hypothetical protein